MNERVTRMRWAPMRSPAVLTVAGLMAAAPAAAADAMPDFLADFNFTKYVDFTTFNWPTMLLAGAIGLLIIALVAKVVIAGRPSRGVESPHADDRIGNMPAEPASNTRCRRDSRSDHANRECADESQVRPRAVQLHDRTRRKVLQ
jgi:hypothetical protein